MIVVDAYTLDLKNDYLFPVSFAFIFFLHFILTITSEYPWIVRQMSSSPQIKGRRGAPQNHFVHARRNSAPHRSRRHFVIQHFFHAAFRLLWNL